jgi:DNA-binding response OmpR family regulator
MLRRMARALRILIVEDDEPLRRMIRHAMALSGYEVQEAGNGLHALHLIDTHPPDAVILDLALPIVSGRAVLAEIAAHAHMREIPFIVITGTPGRHDGLGVVSVLRKPFEMDRLLTAVRGCIAPGVPPRATPEGC